MAEHEPPPAQPDSPVVPIDTMSDLEPPPKAKKNKNGNGEKKDKKDTKKPAAQGDKKDKDKPAGSGDTKDKTDTGKPAGKAKAKAAGKAKAKSAPKTKAKTSTPKKKAVADDEDQEEEKTPRQIKKPVPPVKQQTLKRPAAAKTKVDKDKKEKAHGSGIKRPAAKRDESQDKNKKKKPALFQPLHAAKKKDAKEAKDVGAEEQGEEEKDFENDEEIEFQVEAADTKTDRCKKQKFMTMLAAGQLPDYLAKEWEKTVKMKVGRTDAQRTIINSCFNRGDMGKLILSLEKPLFQTMRNQWSERTASHTEKSLPKTLFMGKFEVRDPEGKVAYSWSASEHKTAKGDKSSFEMSATAQGSKGDAQKMNTLTGGWKMGLFSKQEQGAAAPGGKRTAAQLALEDRKQGLNDLQWQAAQEQLQPAIQAFQKIEKDGLKSWK